MIRFLALVTTFAVFAAAPAAGQEQIERRLVVGDEITFEPGYPVGDVAITDVNVADYRVQPDRTTLLLLGRAAGQTKLNLTDQRRVLRTIVTITVESRELRDLREYLKAYPTVSVQELGLKPIVTGQVTTKADLDAIAKLAQAAGVQSLVTLDAPEVPAPSAAPPAESAAPMAFDVAILEASVAFETGSYATGVEPSGRVLYQQVVRVPAGSQGEIFVPASALGEAVQHATHRQAGTPAPESVGIRITLEPGPRTKAGQFSTFVRIETNVPVEQAPDPTIMRRARWELEGGDGDPFALAGSQLLAVPAALHGGSSKFGRVLRAIGEAARLPGVRSTPAPALVADIPYYDRKKKTQLLALFKPREAAQP